MNDKKLAKIEKLLGKETMGELEVLPVDVLKDTIVSAEHSICEALRKLEANKEYIHMKDSIKDMSAGMRDVRKRQNAIIQYCLSVLESKGGR